MSLFSSAKIEIEFTAGNWTDVSAYYAEPISIHSGRPTEYDTIGPGSATVILYNSDGRFMPENSSGAYYPNVVENKRIRISVTKAGTTTQRFQGYIFSWEPSFPGPTINDAIVTVSALDTLAVMARRTLPLPFLDLAMISGNAASTWVDCFSLANSSLTVTTNTPAGVGSVTSSVVTNDHVTFGTDASVGFDGFASSKDTTAIIGMAYRSTINKVEFWVNGNGGGSQIILQLKDGSNVTQLMVLVDAPTSFVTTDNAGVTHKSLGAVTTQGWVKISVLKNGAGVDLYTNDVFSHNWPAVNINQCVNGKVFNAATAGASIGPILTAGSTAVGVAPNQIVSSLGGWTIGTRLTSVTSEMSDYSPGYATVGSDNGRACVAGSWNGSDALTFLRTIAATNGSIVWARWDGQILFIHPDKLYPTAPLMTVDADGDLQTAPTLKRSADVRPTRVTLNSPALTAAQVAIDTVTEAAYSGASRHDLTVNTLCATTADALDIGWSYMACSSAMRISQLVLDLDAAATDWTSTLFNQSATQGALYPTQRLRLALPTAVFGASTRDVYIQGWTEEYAHDHATITIDCSPATTATVTGGTCVGNTSTGTVIITSDRVWTTVAQAYPMDLDWAGERITVSAPGGSTSPQTFTCTARGVTGGAAASSHSSGTSIDVWHGSGV